jgi:hypothetical protein
VGDRELREAFAVGWRVHEIVPAVFETNLETGDVRAWRATVERV